MNRILLAYCHDNAELANYLDHKLSRIGIPFEHITDQPDTPAGAFSAYLSSIEEPVLLLVTDNLLKNYACMVGLMPALQQLVRQQRLLAIIADGYGPDGEVVSTHIDRMVNAVQYMNHWQTNWLELSTAHQNADPADKGALVEELDQVHNVANQMGDLISTLRDAGYYTEEQLEEQDFALFFQKFGLSDWHGQYRRLAAMDHDTAGAPETGMAQIPALDGPLTPTPAEPLEEMPVPAPMEMEQEPDGYDEAELEAIPEEITQPEENYPEEAEDSPEPEVSEPDPATNLGWPEESAVAEVDPDPSAEIETTIRDAWFWLERGHTERGLDLFQLALEQHPDHENLRNEYALALEQYQPAQEEEPALPEVSPEPEPEIEIPVAIDQPETVLTETAEAKSYDLMGEMALEKGDYLFAKYCWDRSAELDPHYPDVYRKLGLMTSEHLPDYRETAVHYLQKALEINPHDAEVHLALAKMSAQSGDPVQADSWYQRAISLNPGLQSEQYDRWFSAQPAIPEPLPEPVAEPLAAAPESAPIRVSPPREVLTVLVTGATSGIGRATAELFANAGHRLILTGRRIERLVLLKTQLEAELQTDVLILPFDVRDSGAVSAALENLPDAWQNVDILVNNAGLAKGLAPIQEGNLDHWETMIDTNLKGLLYVTRAISPGMVRRGRGHIINIGSSAGKEVYADGNVYCATKFAVDALTRAMRLDLHKHHIRVGQVSPGAVEDTEFAINRFDGDQQRARIYDDFQPLRPEDVASAIYYMATLPAHVNLQDMVLFSTQQASAAVVDRSGRGEIPTASVSLPADGADVLDLLIETKLAASRGAAKRLVEQGGVSVNGARVAMDD
ncbi:MAG: SDR family NAD(P)-dependent oxidoreductase, partial [Saprospiraceae bacterium]